MNRLLVRIQIYESMLRDSLWSPEREAERRRREAEHRWTQFDHTDHTKILDTDSCVCYFYILIWAGFTRLSL